MFGRAQSFVPGTPPEWYLQFMVKDSKKYAATAGWGFAQFTKDGKWLPRRNTRRVSPATSRSRIATSSSPATHRVVSRSRIRCPTHGSSTQPRTRRGKRSPPSAGAIRFKAIFPRMSTGKRFRRFRLRCASPSWWASPPEAGPYVIRVKVPRGVKLMPHRHPEDRVYTVISGVFYIGLGERFDADKLEAFPPGSADRSARQHVPLPLGQMRRIHLAGDRDRAARHTSTSIRKTIPGTGPPGRDTRYGYRRRTDGHT